MGLLSRWRATTNAAAALDIAAADSITVGTPTTGTYTGVLSPLIQDQIAAGINGPWWPAVPRDVALRVPAVRRGVNVIGGAIGAMPLVRRRGLDILPPGTLLTQPEAHRPYVNTVGDTVRDLVLTRYAWWLVIEREWTGYPRRVVRLEPEYVQVETEPGTDEVVREHATYRGSEVNAADLIRFEGPDDGLLVHGAGTICQALTQESTAGRYAEPEVPTGYLKQASDAQYDLDDAEVTALLDGWTAARRLRNTAFLNRSVEYVPVFSTPEALQLVQAREEAALQISRHLNLPPRYVSTSAGDSNTYSNISAERQELVDLSLAPYIGAIEQRLSMPDRNGSPAGQSIRFDVDAFTRPGPAERALIYQQLVPLGVVTVDEARAAERGTVAPTAAAPEVAQ